MTKPGNLVHQVRREARPENCHSRPVIASKIRSVPSKEHHEVREDELEDAEAEWQIMEDQVQIEEDKGAKRD